MLFLSWIFLCFNILQTSDVVYSRINRFKSIGANKMKKILLSLILSSITGFAFADGVKYQPTDREINAIRLIFEDDIKSFINDGETAFEEDYKNNQRLYSLKKGIGTETILKTYSENKAKGDKLYKNKTFIVKGIIKDIYRGSNNEPYVSFATANKYHFNTVEARFKKPEQDKLADFRTLSQIVLSCTGAEIIKDSIALNNCEFVNKKEIIDDTLTSYMNKIEELKLGHIVNVPVSIRQIVFLVSVVSKKTDDFAECKDNMDFKCVNKLLDNIFEQGQDKIMAEFAPLAEYLQLEDK